MAFPGWEKGWGEHSPPLPALRDRDKGKAEAKGEVKAQTGTSLDQQQDKGASVLLLPCAPGNLSQRTKPVRPSIVKYFIHHHTGKNST